MEITTMFNITRKPLFFAVFGVLLAAASNAGHACNVYSAPESEADQTTSKAQPGYWACPPEYKVCPSETLPMTARADDGTRTDAPVFDAPEPNPPIEDSRYYDYSSLILGD
jgi:hypothetical protein